MRLLRHRLLDHLLRVRCLLLVPLEQRKHHQPRHLHKTVGTLSDRRSQSNRPRKPQHQMATVAGHCLLSPRNTRLPRRRRWHQRDSHPLARRPQHRRLAHRRRCLRQARRPCQRRSLPSVPPLPPLRRHLHSLIRHRCLRPSSRCPSVTPLSQPHPLRSVAHRPRLKRLHLSDPRQRRTQAGRL